jgi:hypothetical protein
MAAPSSVVGCFSGVGGGRNCAQNHSAHIRSKGNSFLGSLAVGPELKIVPDLDRIGTELSQIQSRERPGGKSFSAVL